MSINRTKIIFLSSPKTIASMLGTLIGHNFSLPKEQEEPILQPLKHPKFISNIWDLWAQHNPLLNHPPPYKVKQFPNWVEESISLFSFIPGQEDDLLVGESVLAICWRGKKYHANKGRMSGGRSQISLTLVWYSKIRSDYGPVTIQKLFWFYNIFPMFLKSSLLIDMRFVPSVKERDVLDRRSQLDPLLFEVTFSTSMWALLPLRCVHLFWYFF